MPLAQNPSSINWSVSPVPPLAGGGLAAALMYASYRYALKCGLASSEPGTENYG